MPDIGVPELLIVAFIVVLLFGPGKAADLGSALGKGIREFRKASNEDASADAPAAHDGAMAAKSERYCTECGAAMSSEQKFCTACGARVTSPAA